MGLLAERACHTMVMVVADMPATFQRACTILYDESPCQMMCCDVWAELPSLHRGVLLMPPVPLRLVGLLCVRV